MHSFQESAVDARYNELLATGASLTANGLIALHAALFGGINPVAGQIRDTALGWTTRYFAHPSLITLSLEQRFIEVAGVGDLNSLPRDVFFDALAHHVSELHAISPFAIGNRRVIALHIEQIARAAGYGVATRSYSKSLWDEVLMLSFVYRDHRGIACLLKGQPIPVDLFPESVIGDCGLPKLPDRDPSPGRRYQRTIARSRRELEDYLPQARDQAMARVIALTNSAAPRSQLIFASQLLSFLRHPKGPMFQAAVLSAANYGVITPALSDTQSALERVHEIAAAVCVGIAQQSPGYLEFLVETTHIPEYAARGSPHQDRLAALFLGNTADQNRDDPRLTPWQRALDDIVVTAKQNHALTPKRITAKIDQARIDIATRIRSGDVIAAKDAAEPGRTVARAS
jgi:cell filamentation protein